MKHAIHGDGHTRRTWKVWKAVRFRHQNISIARSLAIPGYRSFLEPASDRPALMQVRRCIAPAESMNPPNQAGTPGNMWPSARHGGVKNRRVSRFRHSPAVHHRSTESSGPPPEESGDEGCTAAQCRTPHLHRGHMAQRGTFFFQVAFKFFNLLSSFQILWQPRVPERELRIGVLRD